MFRNKEGHGVLPKHAFDRSNYTDIETALVDLYSRGFSEGLEVRFFLKPGQKGVWRVRRSPNNRRTTLRPGFKGTCSPATVSLLSCEERTC